MEKSNHTDLPKPPNANHRSMQYHRDSVIQGQAKPRGTHVLRCTNGRTGAHVDMQRTYETRICEFGGLASLMMAIQ